MTDARKPKPSTTRQLRFTGLAAASERSSRTARATSRKRDTACELVLRRALWALGLRYRTDVAKLQGRPDIVFSAARVVVFCDGDFWHGRNLEERLKRLSHGHNAPYWVAKIQSNVARDRRHHEALREAGWTVLRFWEGDISRDTDGIAQEVARVVAAARPQP